MAANIATCSNYHLVGVGLRPQHYEEVISTSPSIGWFEFHSENFFDRGGPNLSFLKLVRNRYPVSLHGVGLSLGSSGGVSRAHLARLKTLANLVDPLFISEHLSWSTVKGIYLPDLLPVPYNEESLRVISDNINVTQDALKREILIENPSSYIEYYDSDIFEADFLVSLCKNTGAKILLDVNNIFVSCVNHRWDSRKYIDSIPQRLVKEIHIAGHSERILANNETTLFDTHDNSVRPEVWDLYNYAISRFGQVHTLLEWDSNLPSLNSLIGEANKALLYLNNSNIKPCVNA